MTEAEIEGVASAVLRAAGSRLGHYTPANRKGIVDAARAAIAALDKARKGGWRTMDSAPTDGQALLAVVCGQVRVVAYTKTSHVPITGFCLADQGADDSDLCNPTCWQPLPATPTTEGE